jgi:hypothetical protein
MNTETDGPKTMAEAIDAGIAAADPNPPAAAATSQEEAADETENGELDTGVGEGGEGETEALDGGAPAGATDGKVAADGKAAPAGDGKTPVAGADAGKKPDAGKPGEKPSEKTPEQVAAEAAAAAAAAKKPPDPLEDPIPNALKPATKERIRTLIDRTKTAEARVATVEATFNTIVQRVQDTGATPEQYGQAIEYLGMVNSGDPEQIKRALEFVEGERIALARMAGVALPGVSFLDDHPDLQRDVAANKITPERAEEIAASRAAAQHAANVRAQRQNLQDRAAAGAEQFEAAKTALNDLEVQIKGKDPLYAVKRPIIIRILKPIFAQLHPSKWPAEFQRVYKELPAPVRPGPGPGTTGKPAASAPGAGNQPLRASQPAGGQVSAPKTMAEAIDFGISQAGAR